MEPTNLEERQALVRALIWAADQAAALGDKRAESHIRRAIAALNLTPLN